VDGGSSIDILFRSSLPDLKLTQVDLKSYDAWFWGVLPGQSSIPLGQITLPVQFSNPNHFRTNYVNFVVVNFEGTYHAILGRPVLNKFMAVLHYSYLVLKMPTSRVSLLSEAMFTLPIPMKRKDLRWQRPPTSQFTWSKPWSMPPRFPPPN
jgi:hypothetical protein